MVDWCEYLAYRDGRSFTRKKGRNIMETVYTSSWLNRLHALSSRILMPFMAVLFISTNTVVNLWSSKRIETVQNILAILLLGIVAWYLLSSPKQRVKPWLKANFLVVAYFLVRLISLWQSGFDYSVIRSLIFELFFLIGICDFTVNSKSRGKFYITFFMWFELIVTALCILIFIIVPHMDQTVQDLISSVTYYMDDQRAALFSNVNFAGAIAGIAIVISVIIYNKKVYNDKLVIAFGAYNLFCLIFFGARSAEAGMIAVAFFFVLKKVLPKISIKKMTISVLILMVITLIPLYIFIGYNESKLHMSYTVMEDKFNSISTERYLIWKESYITQQDDLFFGKGSIKLDQQARKDMIAEYKPGQIDYRYFVTAEFVPHNGYIGMISVTGWLGFILFVAILIQRIWRSRNMKSGNWYLMLIYVFTINCFECWFILTRFMACFYMFLILEADWEGEEDVVINNANLVK
mgnify:FL=1